MDIAHNAAAHSTYLAIIQVPAMCFYLAHRQAMERRRTWLPTQSGVRRAEVSVVSFGRARLGETNLYYQVNTTAYCWVDGQPYTLNDHFILGNVADVTRAQAEDAATAQLDSGYSRSLLYNPANPSQAIAFVPQESRIPATLIFYLIYVYLPALLYLLLAPT